MCENAYRAKQLERPEQPEDILDPGGLAGERASGKELLVAWAGILAFCFLFFWVMGMVIVRAAQGIWALLAG